MTKREARFVERKERKNRWGKRGAIACLLALLFATVTGCGGDSSFKQEYEASGYKRLAIYKAYNTRCQDLEDFEKDHGYLSIASEDGGQSVEFRGFYQMKCVHIGTQDLSEAFRTKTVEEFASACGYESYLELASDPSFRCGSEEIFSHDGYSVYFEKLDSGGADLHLGKRFEYNFEGDEQATLMYGKLMELLSKDTYSPFEFGESQCEGATSGKDIAYAVALGMDDLERGESNRECVLVGDTRYKYNLYSEMERFLFSLDMECEDVVKSLKDGDTNSARKK